MFSVELCCFAVQFFEESSTDSLTMMRSHEMVRDDLLRIKVAHVARQGVVAAVVAFQITSVSGDEAVCDACAVSQGSGQP